MRVHPGAFLRWLGRHELGSILAFCVLAGAALAFTKIASEVREGDATSIDRKLLLLLRNPHDLADPLGPAWLEEAGRAFRRLAASASSRSPRSPWLVTSRYAAVGGQRHS